MQFLLSASWRVGPRFSVVKDRERRCLLMALIMRREGVIICKALAVQAVNKSLVHAQMGFLSQGLRKVRQ